MLGLEAMLLDLATFEGEDCRLGTRIADEKREAHRICVLDGMLKSTMKNFVNENLRRKKRM